MLDPKFFDNLAKQLASLVPDNVKHIRDELEKNTRAKLLTIFANLDLVTRKDFDIQVKLLQKARERIAILEDKIDSYEQAQAQETSHPDIDKES